MLMRCLYCQKDFKTYRKRTKFCSRNCRNLDYKTRVKEKNPLWKAIKIICQICKKEFYRKPSYVAKWDTKHCSMKCYRKTLSLRWQGNTLTNGVAPWNKNKKVLQITGDKNYLWKGDKVSYGSLHDWVKRHLGKPDTCEHCGKNGLSGKKIHWANKSHEYKRDLTDWLRLCVSCHKAYDKISQVL